MKNIKTLVVFVAAATIAASFLLVKSTGVSANPGKKSQCADADYRSYESGDEDEMVFQASEGEEVTGVCIKSGINMFDSGHSGVVGNGTYEDGCYLVEGVGTSEVKVTRLKEGRYCQGLSHLDIYTKDHECEEPTPTPTDVPESTPTPTPTQSPEPTVTVTPTPTEVPEDDDDDSHDNSGGSSENNNSSEEVLGEETTVLAYTGNEIFNLELIMFSSAILSSFFGFLLTFKKS
jgi:hypothetical protein